MISKSNSSHNPQHRVGEKVPGGMQATTNQTPEGAPRSPYLTAVEAAEYLRTTVQGIYSLVKRGKIQPMPGRPGRLLFTRGNLKDVEKFPVRR